MPQMGKTEVCQHRSQMSTSNMYSHTYKVQKIPTISRNLQVFLNACRGSTLSRGYCKSWKERMLSVQAKEADDFKSKNKEGNR